jgi:rSAM/selenodomain-associated transferase 1
MEKTQPPDRLIIIFYRNPVAGHVKTRLASGVGKEKALEIHIRLSTLTMQAVTSVTSAKVVFYDREILSGDFWEDHLFNKELQKGADLGERMYNAFQRMFRTGYQSIIIIGTDCPEITGPLLESAFENLQKHDAVIGPAFDGGYYLLGLKALAPELFSGIKWGSASVFDQTMLKLKLSGKSVHCLARLHDIDRPEDLPFLK